MEVDGYNAAKAGFAVLVAGFDGVGLKGKKTPYTSLNGHMNAFLDPGGQVCLRLSKPDMAAFLQAYPGDPVVQYGAVMREYVAVPANLLADIAALAPWFRRSRDHVGGLKPKKTTRG